MLKDGVQPEFHESSDAAGLGYFVFAVPEPGKYDPGYAARYAALWAFGYLTLGLGAAEPLYRTIDHLAARALVSTGSESLQTILDIGCGVGRCACDLADLAPKSVVLAADASDAMLELACRAASGNVTKLDLSAYGFGAIDLPRRGPYPNLTFVRCDGLDTPFKGSIADVILCVNVADRVASPRLLFEECHRLLRPGGQLVFSSPLNWSTSDLWARYPSAHSIMNLAKEEIGFEIEESFDRLVYKEYLDARLSFQAFNALVFRARKSF